MGLYADGARFDSGAGFGSVTFKGVWTASTNSPALASGIGTKGDYYIVGTAGGTNLNGITDWQVGDWAVFSGTVWQKVDNTAGLPESVINYREELFSGNGTATLFNLTQAALTGATDEVQVFRNGMRIQRTAVAPTTADQWDMPTNQQVRLGTAPAAIESVLIFYPT